MSIASFKKVTILGLSRSKASILEAMQALGCMHLIAIKKPTKSELITSTTTLLDKLKTSLRYLKESPEQGTPRTLWKEFYPDGVVEQVLANQNALKQCIDRRDFLIKKIEDVASWGQFIFPDKAELSGIKLWFYKLKLQERDLIPKNLPVHEVHRNSHYLFVVLLSKEEPDGVKLSTFRVHMGSSSLNELYAELDELNEQFENLVDERRSLTRFRYLLSKELAQFTDRSELNKALGKTHDHQEFFLMQGWLPESHVAALERYCQQHQVGVTIEEPCDDELPPTLLESPAWLKGGSELVNFYQTPGYHALDPSLMVFFSFALFFSMILADAGYGLVIALLTLLGWRRLSKSKIGAWFRPLLVVLSLFSITYGVLLGSYWGVEPKKGSFLAQLKIINIHDFKSMMALVIVIGCVHLCIGCGLRAWFARHVNERIQALAFIVLISSALVYAAGRMHSMAQLMDWATISFVLSLLMILLFSDNAPITGFKSLIKRLIKGLASCAELPSLFGDILSYLRLFALGLAGASLAITFNSIAAQLSHVSWVLAVLVLVIGQGLNFVLCLMSAVIHGLRLNYIEFFKWSVKEDGYGYQPFKKQEISNE